MRVLGWRAWFVGGSVYSSADVAPADLPREGCLGFMLYYHERVFPGGPRYRDIVKGGDWYVVRPSGRVVRHGRRHDGQWDGPPEVADGEVLIKSAPSLPDAEWERVAAEMWEAREWP